MFKEQPIYITVKWEYSKLNKKVRSLYFLVDNILRQDTSSFSSNLNGSSYHGWKPPHLF